MLNKQEILKSIIDKSEKHVQEIESWLSNSELYLDKRTALYNAESVYFQVLLHALSMMEEKNDTQ